jgi:hypothetical protein
VIVFHAAWRSAEHGQMVFNNGVDAHHPQVQ